MGVIEFVLLAAIATILTSVLVWAIGYFAPSPVPPLVFKMIWGLVILALLWVLLGATGILGHDIPIPRLK